MLPQSVTEIPAGAFYDLRKLHTVVLSYSTTSIGEKAFAGCYNLRNIFIPDTVKTIHASAFSGCNKNNIHIPASVKNASELEFFGGKTELEKKITGYAATLNVTNNEMYMSTEFYSYDKVTKKYTKIVDQEKNWIVLENLEPGKTYYFVARGYRQTDTGRLYYTKSDMLTVTMPPEKVSKVTYKATATSITLNWTKSENATGYRVYYKPVYYEPWKSVATTSKLTCTLNNLELGDFNSIAVRPYIKTASGEVLWGAYDTIVVPRVPETPVAKVASPSKGKITVSWAEADGAEKYQLYYKTGTGKYKLYKTYDSAQNLTFSNLKSGTKYTFAVRAYWSYYSNNYYSAYTPVAVTVK